VYTLIVQTNTKLIMKLIIAFKMNNAPYGETKLTDALTADLVRRSLTLTFIFNHLGIK